jgi:hypothetical protein
VEAKEKVDLKDIENRTVDTTLRKAWGRDG